MLARLLRAGLLAGLVAAIAFSVVQIAAVQPLIIAAEVFEEGATQGAAGHSHDAVAGHAHDGEGWAPADGLERATYTVLANLVAGIGFALLLVAGIAASGRQIDGPRGLAWGLAGFVVFSLAPAFGLPPELPGAAAAPVALRQVWWLAVVASTAGGLWLLAFAPARASKVIGLVLLFLPHLFGAPHPEANAVGVAPPELAAQFAARALVAAAVFWAVLGWTTGALIRRSQPAPA